MPRPARPGIPHLTQLEHPPLVEGFDCMVNKSSDIDSIWPKQNSHIEATKQDTWTRRGGGAKLDCHTRQTSCSPSLQKAAEPEFCAHKLSSGALSENQKVLKTFAPWAFISALLRANLARLNRECTLVHLRVSTQNKRAYHIRVCVERGSHDFWSSFRISL